VTVRAWLTISALVLVALFGAVAYQFLRPVTAPGIIVNAGNEPLAGRLVESCWPQRNGDLKCEQGDDGDAETLSIPASGELRSVVAYPAQPEEGSIRIISRDSGETVLRSGWDRSITYELDPGLYFVDVEARYPERAFVRYRFGFLRVTRSGA
jgi:hypothetical protein